MQRKIFLLSFLAIFFMIETNAQTKKPAEAKAAKVSETVETALQDMAKTIEKTDWSSLTDILTTTVSLIEKHVDAVQQIVQDVDTKPLEKEEAIVASHRDKADSALIIYAQSFGGEHWRFRFVNPQAVQ